MFAVVAPVACTTTTNVKTKVEAGDDADALKKKVADLEARLSVLEKGRKHRPSSDEIKRERAEFLQDVRRSYDAQPQNSSLEESVKRVITPLTKDFTVACRDSVCEVTLRFPDQQTYRQFVTAMFFRPEGPAWPGSSTTVSTTTSGSGVTVDLFLGDNAPAPPAASTSLTAPKLNQDAGASGRIQ